MKKLLIAAIAMLILCGCGPDLGNSQHRIQLERDWTRERCVEELNRIPAEAVLVARDGDAMLTFETELPETGDE